MNRNKRPMDKKACKGVEKAIRKGQKELDKPQTLKKTDSLTTKEVLDQYPKLKKEAKPLVDALVREMEIKKKKKHAKSSKRTTSGTDIDHRMSPPAHPHKEGARWEETLRVQSKQKDQALRSKLQKSKKKRPSS